MATTFFFLDAASDLSEGSFVDKALSTTRGGAAVSKATNTVAGPVSSTTPWPIVTNGAGSTVIAWYTPPLNAVTITPNNGVAPTANLRGLESAVAANATFQIEINEVDGVTGAVVGLIWESRLASRAELGTSEGALSIVPNVADGEPGRTILDGNRLRVRVALDDATGVTMGSGRTVTFVYNGPTGGASGDSFVTFAETITPFISRRQSRSISISQAVMRASTY